MKYAKLNDGEPVFAPNPILHEGYRIGNPPGEIYTAEEYKPVTYTNPPTEPTEGYQWSESWSETETEIVQGWVLVEAPEPELSADEALDILLGGAAV